MTKESLFRTNKVVAVSAGDQPSGTCTTGIWGAIAAH